MKIILATGRIWEEPFVNRKQVKAFVGGRIEVVRTKDGMAMCVDDNGLLKDLPPNEKALELTGKPLVGDVVVLTPEEEEAYNES